jgi:hypothetical protein
MSNCETQQGWFYMQLGQNREALCYRCNCCGLFQMFAPEQRQRVWCCNEWKEKPSEGFWAGTLPRVPYIAPRGLLVLEGDTINLTDCEIKTR